MALKDDLEKQFPNLVNEPATLTSPPDPAYNCIAWAYGVNDKKFWPNAAPEFHWPKGVPNKNETKSFIKLFESIGYEQCADGTFEAGFTKIAIYNKAGKPQHAARQLDANNWTSKLGPQVDISHSIPGMNGGHYGNAEIFMKRAI